MLTRTILASLLALSACGSNDGNDAPRTDGGGAASCADADVLTTLMVPKIPYAPGSTSTTVAEWKIDAIGASIIAHAGTAEGDLRVAKITGDGTVTDLARLVGAQHQYFQAAALKDPGCALVANNDGISLACDGKPLETAPIDDARGSSRLFPVETASSLFVYTQTHASFTEIERTATGVWTEHEQYESSISMPTDATLAGGTPIACFITAGDRASVIRGGAQTESVETARWCKLAVDGTTVHVLTDVGYTSRDLASLAADGVLALVARPVDSEPDRLVMVAGQPVAVTPKTATIDLVGLDGTVVQQLPRPIGNLAFGFDATTGALEITSTTTEASGDGPMYAQTIRHQTVCM